ncbi:MAG: MBL fold metallo-hydrolase [Acidothermaceae bacterium]
MHLTVIGCAGSHPGPESGCSSYLLTHDGFRLLIDLGNGALGELQNHVDPRDVDAIFITHLHGDHWLDLVPLAHVRRHHPDGRVPPVIPVFAPAAERGRVSGAFGRPVESLADVFEFHNPRETTIGPFEVIPLRTRHPVETYAVRVSSSGKTLVYTADTGPFDELAGFARGTDLLLAEAGFVDGADNPPDSHLTATQAGELAKQTAAGRLVITHVAPWHDAAVQRDRAARAFGGPTELARRGSTFVV